MHDIVSTPGSTDGTLIVLWAAACACSCAAMRVLHGVRGAAARPSLRELGADAPGAVRCRAHKIRVKTANRRAATNWWEREQPEQRSRRFPEFGLTVVGHRTERPVQHRGRRIQRRRRRRSAGKLAAILPERQQPKRRRSAGLGARLSLALSNRVGGALKRCRFYHVFASHVKSILADI